MEKKITKAVVCRIYPDSDQKAYLEMCFSATRRVWNECVQLLNDSIDIQVFYGWPARWPSKQTYAAGERGPRPFPDKFAKDKDGKLQPIISPGAVPSVFEKQLITNHIRGGGRGRIDGAAPPKWPAMGRLMPVDITNKVAFDDFKRAIDMYLKKGGRPPKFKSHRDKQSFGVQGKDVWFDNETLKLSWPKRESVFHCKRLRQGKNALPADARILRLRFSKSKLGEYYVSLSYEVIREVPDAPEQGRTLGIDMGVRDWITVADGDRYLYTLQLPPEIKKLFRKKRKAEVNLARKREQAKREGRPFRGANYAKELRRFNTCWKDIKHQRESAVALAVHRLTSEPDVKEICVEALKIKNMTKQAKSTQDEDTGKWTRVSGKRGLNREILNGVWGIFLNRLEQKCEEKNIAFRNVPPHNTSKTCGVCGYHNRDLKSEKNWSCLACGATHDRDENAAMNIARGGALESEKYLKARPAPRPCGVQLGLFG